jgi:hypothetical protein
MRLRTPLPNFEAKRLAELSWRLTRSPPTRARLGRTGLQGLGQARRVGRVVLAVAVQGDDDRGAGGQHAAAHGAALARVLAVAQHAQLRDLGLQRRQQGLGVVAAGVVDEDDLVVLAREGAAISRARAGAAPPSSKTGTTTE